MRRTLPWLLMLGSGAALARLDSDLPLSQVQAEFAAAPGVASIGDAVAFAGDVDGDGYDDLLFGAQLATGGAFQAGKAWLVMGLEGGIRGTFYLDDEAQAIFLGEEDGDLAGSSVSGAGDLDGDGFDDYLIGAYGANSQAGHIYLFYGAPEAPTGVLSLSSADAIIVGHGSGDNAGLSLAPAGDLNGDGYADVLISSQKEDAGSFRNAGAAYVFLGSPARLSGSISIREADAVARGGRGGDQFGSTVAGGQDLNGDGIDDFVFGSPRADPFGRGDAGAAYVFLGSLDFYEGEIPTSSAEVIVAGEAGQNYLGTALALIPDLSGDGLAELLIGAPNNSTVTTQSGAAYLLPGRPAGTWTAPTIEASDWRLVYGAQVRDLLGTEVASPGDIDGDDLGDLLVAAPLSDPLDLDSGEIGIFYGGEPLPTQGSLLEADARLLGQGRYAGQAMATGGDLDADGWPDLLIGSPGDGRAYLVLVGEYIDQDRDGFKVVDGDCDDHDGSVGPGFPELCNATDSDCDGSIDEGCQGGEGTPPGPTPTPSAATPSGGGQSTPGGPTQIPGHTPDDGTDPTGATHRPGGTPEPITDPPGSTQRPELTPSPDETSAAPGSPPPGGTPTSPGGLPTSSVPTPSGGPTPCCGATHTPGWTPGDGETPSLPTPADPSPTPEGVSPTTGEASPTRSPGAPTGTPASHSQTPTADGSTDPGRTPTPSHPLDATSPTAGPSLTPTLLEGDTGSPTPSGTDGTPSEEERTPWPETQAPSGHTSGPDRTPGEGETPGGQRTPHTQTPGPDETPAPGEGTTTTSGPTPRPGSTEEPEPTGSAPPTRPPPQDTPTPALIPGGAPHAPFTEGSTPYQGWLLPAPWAPHLQIIPTPTAAAGPTDSSPAPTGSSPTPTAQGTGGAGSGTSLGSSLAGASLDDGGLNCDHAPQGPTSAAWSAWLVTLIGALLRRRRTTTHCAERP